MFEKVIRYVAALLAVLWTGLSGILAIVGFTLKRKLGFYFYRLWGVGLCKIMDIRITITGLENWLHHETYIVASNHCSMWDIPVIASIPRDHAWIAKEEISRIPIVGTAMRKMGCYFVKRRNSESDREVLNQAEQQLMRGGPSIVIFPEGTRSPNGELQSLKKGAFHMVNKSARPLLPVAIYGTFQIAPKGHFLPHRGRKVLLVIGHPMVFETDTSIKVMIETFENRLRDLIINAKNIVMKN